MFFFFENVWFLVEIDRVNLVSWRQMSKSDRFVPATSGFIVTHIFSSRQWRIMIKKVARPSKTCRCLYRRTLNVHLRRFNAAIRFQDGGGSRQQQPKDPPRMKCCTIWIWRFSGGFLFFFFVGDAQGGPAGPRLLWKSGGSDGWHSVTVWVGHFQSADADWQQVAFCVISIGPMCGPPPRQSIFCINKDKAHKRRRAEIEKIFNAAPLRRMHFSLNILFFFTELYCRHGAGT